MKKTSFIIISFVLAASFLCFFRAGIAEAGLEHNVSGWAWASNIGWISFNCTNDASCNSSNYGVKIDLISGDFSGYAWSSNIGWIDFAPTSGFPEAPNSGAHYDSATGAVTGWAKILSMGDDGWIKFNGTWTTPVVISSTTGDFSGYAWSSDVGWISFNCSNEDPPCSGTNYKVIAEINNAPTVSNMTAPNWSYVQAQNNAKYAKLSFDFIDPDSGSYGSKYRLIVKKSDDSSVIDTGECTGYVAPPNYCKIDNSICMKNNPAGCLNPGDCTCQYPLDAELEYNTSYKWLVQVWDNNNAYSTLTQYNTNPDTDNDDQTILTFTTYKHEFPDPNATWFPTSPSQGEKVKFTDTSKIYESNDPDFAVSCNSDRCDWLWTPPVSATIDDTATSTPTITFNTAGLNTVKLKITDVDGYYTEINIPIDVNSKLPKWKEVKPE